VTREPAFDCTTAVVYRTCAIETAPVALAVDVGGGIALAQLAASDELRRPLAVFGEVGSPIRAVARGAVECRHRAAVA
jgi:hypothetical protein